MTENAASADAARREFYEQYVAAFNSHDLHQLEFFLDEDVVFDWGDDMDALVGRQAFFDFYATAWSYFDEVISTRILATTSTTLTAWIETDLHIVRDWPDCPLEPYRAGDDHHYANEITYTFRDGKIVNIA